jgi:hypothetical protein
MSPFPGSICFHEPRTDLLFCIAMYGTHFLTEYSSGLALRAPTGADLSSPDTARQAMYARLVPGIHMFVP